jgi:hypothetical protein
VLPDAVLDVAQELEAHPGDPIRVLRHEEALGSERSQEARTALSGQPVPLSAGEALPTGSVARMCYW